MKEIKIYDVSRFRNGLSVVQLHTTACEEIYITRWKGYYTLFVNHFATDCMSDEHILSDDILNRDVCLIHERDIDVIKVKALINNLLYQYYTECENIECKVEYEVTPEQLQKEFYCIAD